LNDFVGLIMSQEQRVSLSPVPTDVSLFKNCLLRNCVATVPCRYLQGKESRVSKGTVLR